MATGVRAGLRRPGHRTSGRARKCNLVGGGSLTSRFSLGASSAFYTARHFSIETDLNDLFSPSLPWTKRAFEYMRTFAQYDILIVVSAPSPELVEQAPDKLPLALATRTDVVRDVRDPQSGKFFKQNALLFLLTSKVAAITDGLARVRDLGCGSKLKGTLDALALGLMGMQRGELKEWNRVEIGGGLILTAAVDRHDPS